MPQLCLITALPAETRPLLDTLKLRQQQAAHLRVFARDMLLLLESGPGKLNAAACTAAALQQYPQIKAILNIGIAGACHEYGQTLLAHRIVDNGSGMQWYPHLPGDKAFKSMQSLTLMTVDRPATNYEADIMFDMEAAGVYSAATRYLSSSYIHSVKVISDNPHNSLNKINKQTVSALITNALPNITALIEALLASLKHDQYLFNENVTHCVDSICERIHHSTNDKHLLRRLVQQYFAISGTLPQTDPGSKTARELRDNLRKTLRLTPFIYTEQ
jgi:nucleoside phosphorylase